jgi:serine/threonine protein kinase
MFCCQGTSTRGARTVTVNGRVFVGTFYNGAWFSPEVYQFYTPQDNPALPSYTRDSDIWPVGLLFFYIASRGCCPIVNETETEIADRDQERRVSFLRRTRGELLTLLSELTGRKRVVVDGWRLDDANPLLFDLIERMVRPRAERISLADCSVHPFFWDAAVVENMVMAVGEQPGEPASKVAFRTELDAICAADFSGPNGWDPMHLMFHGLQNPAAYDRSSASALLRALRDALPGYVHNVNTTNTSSKTFREDAIQALQALYPNVLLKLFETTIEVNADRTGRYGVWRNAFTEALAYEFRR